MADPASADADWSSRRLFNMAASLHQPALPVAVVEFCHAHRFKDRTLLISIPTQASPSAYFIHEWMFGRSISNWRALVGRTPIGRVTVHVLAMNADDLLLIRVELLKEGTL
jgi:hypothetical protein